jgi:hypothetical protein
MIGRVCSLFLRMHCGTLQSNNNSYKTLKVGNKKEPKDKKGIVSKPIVDFIEPRD